VPAVTAGRAETQSPTLRVDAATAVSAVILVVADQVTAVWSVRVCTCIVEPWTAAISPFAPGTRPPKPPCP